jgi:molybdenum cofactor cytidylyltransferase
LLARTVRAILAHCDHGVICVLGAHAADMRPALDGFDVQIVVNTDWREGIGASIRVGVGHVPTDTRAILLAVCDQPLVCSADFARLIADWRIEPGAVAAAGYGDGYGVPAIFPAAYRGDLAALHGDRGAKALIGGASHRRIVEMPNAAFDVDDSADLARLQEITG